MPNRPALSQSEKNSNIPQAHLNAKPPGNLRPIQERRRPAGGPAEGALVRRVSLSLGVYAIWRAVAFIHEDLPHYSPMDTRGVPSQALAHGLGSSLV